MKKIKRIAAGIMAVAAMATGMVGFNASAISVSTPYGTMKGTSHNTTWQMAGSSVHRKVTATTTIPNAVSNIYAEVNGYLNGKAVLHNVDKRSDSATAYASDMSPQYANSALSGGGIHSIWTATYARKDHVSYFS